jgi:methionyl-tRNA formyltransferase
MERRATPLNVAFAGTPAFAATALTALVAAGHRISLVLTQPDRPAGRGLQLQPSAVKQCAQDLGITVVQPRGLRLDGRHADDAARARHRLADVRADVLVVVAYGLILPRWVLDLPRHGCLNIHASLLPRWRGAAPIQRAIEAGDEQSGVCIMRMDDGLDTGEILRTTAEPIHPSDTAGTLHDRLAVLGAREIVGALADLQVRGGLSSQPQLTLGVTYAHKIEKSEAAIDWRAPAELIERRVRAFDPFPGCAFEVGGQTVKLWRARAHPHLSARAGTVVDLGAGRLAVACGTGVLECLEVQRPGGRRQSTTEWLRAWRGPLPIDGETLSESAGPPR